MTGATYLNPTRRLEDRHVVDLADREKHIGGGERLDQGAAFLAHVQKVHGKQGEYFLGVHETAVFIHDADTVSIPVSGESNRRIVPDDLPGKFAQVFADGLGLYAREKRISHPVDLVYLDLAALQQAFEVTDAGAEH